MTATAADVFDLLKKMRMDLTQLQARVTELSNMLSALNLPEPKRFPCVLCGAEPESHLALLDHRVNVHDDEQALDEREAEWRRLEELAV